VNRSVALIALQEFNLNRRNKWILYFAGLFVCLTFFISYFGMVTSGYSGFQDFVRTSTSLINLTALIIPLFALILGVLSFISNREYFDLMVTQPIARHKIILGKYFGLLVTLVIATLLGFGISGIMISLNIGFEGALNYLFVVLFSIILGMVFTSCAVLISVLAHRRQMTMALAIAVWLFFEIIYGILILGSTLYLTASALKKVLILGLFANPIDIFRVTSLVVVGGVDFFGPAGTVVIKLLGAHWLVVVVGVVALFVWTTVPLYLSIRIFKRQNL
jgi:Cu-processing system permease protein